MDIYLCIYRRSLICKMLFPQPTNLPTQHGDLGRRRHFYFPRLLLLQLRLFDLNLLQRLRDGLLLLLQFELVKVLGVFRPLVVDSALGLCLTLPPPGTFIFALGNRLSAMPITNALVTLIQQRIVRYIVLIDVLPNLLEGPIRHGVDLDQTSIVDFDNVQIPTLPSLAASAAGQPAFTHNSRYARPAGSTLAK